MRGTAAMFAATWLLAAQSDTAFLAWSAKDAERIGLSLRVSGRVGGVFDTRGLQTDRASNYKLLATWLTPDVIRATIRLRQFANRLPDAEAANLANSAISPLETVVMIELDPREGSGVIPDDWIAFLQPRTGKDRSFPTIAGQKRPSLRTDAAFQGVVRRNYDYDRFWVAFPLQLEGRRAIPPDATHVDLVVRVHDKEGRVTWPISSAARTWLAGR